MEMFEELFKEAGADIDDEKIRQPVKHGEPNKVTYPEPTGIVA